MSDVKEALESSDPRIYLTGLRDYLIHELTGNRCKACDMSKLRTGDTAALVMRLQNVLAEINGLPSADGDMDEVEDILDRRNVHPIRRLG